MVQLQEKGEPSLELKYSNIFSMQILLRFLVLGCFLSQWHLVSSVLHLLLFWLSVF